MLGEEGVGSTVCQCGRPGMKASEYQQRLRISRARELPELSGDSADWYDAKSILESHTHRDPPLNCVAGPSVSSIADCRASGQGFAALREFRPCERPLWVRSGHHPFTKPCPLCHRKRTNS